MIDNIYRYIKDNNRTISACELVEMVLNIKDLISMRCVVSIKNVGKLR